MGRLRGFTLVETTVAAVLLCLGVLAASATWRSAGRLALLGARQARAAELARARLSLLEAVGCAASAGSGVQGAFAETWSVDAARPARADVAVSFVHDARVRTVRLTELLRCGP
jgi:Tfp pilus assembly protein PilV